MSRRHVLAASAALLLAASARAEGPAPAPEAAPVDPRVEALIKAAVDKAKVEMRDEVRADLQGAQSAAEFMGTAPEGQPKLQHLEYTGYLRVRADLYSNFTLKRGPDADGYYLYPLNPLTNSSGSTQTTTNMRLQVLPTLNISEHVRIRSEVDLLDNYVLGASSGGEFTGPATIDRPLVEVKRLWGEVETPVGLISVGRMPVAFGLGLVMGDPNGLDDDFGDTRDRLQFATLPLTTPVGQLSLVPFFDYNDDGTLVDDPRYVPGMGQPIDPASGDNRRTLGIKILRLDTEDELRRKLERGESSTNFGAMYTYSAQRMVKYAWYVDPAVDPTAVNLRDQYYSRSEYRNELSLWFRHRTARLAVEAEVAGVLGQIGDPGPYTATVNWTGPQVTLAQLGGALRATYQVAPNKVTLGGELGFASGDSAPGFGNQPTHLSPTASASGGVTQYGSTQGPQYDPARGDHTIDSFHFNPGYLIDVILWRELLGPVTDAWYVKPTVRWDIFSGLALAGQLVYSQAIDAASTPSATSATTGAKPLGLELDAKLDYATDDGFVAWVQFGGLVPLAGLEGAGSLSKAYALRTGVALRF